MKTFNVLFVDDDRGQMSRSEELAESLGAEMADHGKGLRLHWAGSTEGALDLLAKHFFHLAIVDVSLTDTAGQPEPTGGIEVLRKLRHYRPSCERLLLTTVNEERHDALDAFFPETDNLSPLVNGFVDKLAGRLRPHQIIDDRARRWLTHEVGLEGANRVMEHLTERGVAGEEVSREHGDLQLTRDEVETVLAQLFGQGRIRPGGGIDVIDTVNLQMISQGWSKDAVLWCEPSIGSRPGPRCLVKVGPRDDSIQEVGRYESYVRFGLGLNHRVELLGSVVGDTIGAACYTHVEARGEEQRDLQQLFDEEAAIGIEAIRQLFDPRSRSWAADPTVEEDLAEYFSREYVKTRRNLRQSLHAFINRMPDLTLLEGRTRVEWRGRELPVVMSDDLGQATFTGSYPACVVHGDLHGGNVLVTGSGQPVLIDYRNMGRGPRVLDFVSLEVSVRMAAGAMTELDELGPELFDAERAAWERDWSGSADGPEGGTEPPLREGAYWEQTSSALRHLARLNHPDVDPSEYAVTALLRALRVLAAKAPHDLHRLRLLPYVALLTNVIRNNDD